MFVADTIDLNAADKAVRQRLETLGFEIKVKAAREVLISDADGSALVLISTTVHSGVDSQVKALRDIRVPLITWEINLIRDFGMTRSRRDTDYGEVPGKQRLVIVNPNHPLAAGLSGSVEVFAKPCRCVGFMFLPALRTSQF